MEMSELDKIREAEAKMAKSQVTEQLKKAFNKLADDHTKRTGEPAPKYRISTPAAFALHLLIIRMFRHKREEAAILCAAEQKKTLLRKHFETADRMHAVASNQVRCVSDITKDEKGRIVHVPGTMKMVADTGSRLNPVLWPLNVQRPAPTQDSPNAVDEVAKPTNKKRKSPSKPRAPAKSTAGKSKKKTAAKPTKKPKALAVKKRTVSKKTKRPAKKLKSKKSSDEPEEEVEEEEEQTTEASDDNDGVASSEEEADDDGGSSSDADFASQ